MLPEQPPLPALTRAEGEVVDTYLEILDLLGRINPGRGGDTYRALRAGSWVRWAVGGPSWGSGGVRVCGGRLRCRGRAVRPGCQR
ncbi:hypothetical protein HLB32_19060, partial [Streptomyces cacaoi]|nr:hypothetical protein [Streptomyces cacaoi]